MMDVVGETLLSVFLEGLVDRLLSMEFMNFIRGGELNNSIEKLKLALSIVANVVNNAEERQFEKPNIDAWLKQLKHAVYDAEDVLDEIMVKALEEQLKPKPQINRKVWDIISKCRKMISDTLKLFNESTESKINKIVDTLEYLVKQKDVLGLQDTVGESLSPVGNRLETTSLPNEICVYGRDKDREEIIDLLLLDDAASINGVCVIPLVGMAGVGKTTLAQVIYNDNRVKEYFDLKAWVCVHDQFDVKKVTRMILESISRESCVSDDLNSLQVNLQEKIMGKKLFLILDDVWDEDYNKWVALQKPFRTSAQGSKILLTTRNGSVSSIMRTVPDCNLEKLSDDDCWSLFSQHAFQNFSIVDPNMEAIGREIAKRCKGLPLAASTIGGLLRSKLHADEWDDILNSKIWYSSDNNGILPALWLSYHHLPVYLKRCFMYCSIFPKNYEFKEEELVLLWMAEGFVPQLKGVRMEDIGRKYFHDLLSRSLFQQSSAHDSVFVMHDFTHDLAKSVSKGICFTLEDMSEGDKQYEIPQNARHWSYIRDYYEACIKFEALGNAEFSLRTFLPLDGGRRFSYLPNKVLLELLQKFTFLRVLSLNNYQINNLPESIGKLKHLRYLDLSHSLIRRLPESIGTLYNLQTLLLVGCHSLTEFSIDIGNLINLRHLDMSQSSLQKMPLGIGRLVSLQRLSNFVVGEQGGAGIRELRNLLHIRGSLSISGLQNVLDVREVVEANFENKQYLNALVLEWSKAINVLQNEKSAEELLDIILLRTKLKDLTISYYSGKRLPTPHYHCMESLVLTNMLKWVEWSPLGIEEHEIFCSLRQLEIRACPRLRKISHRFSKLQKLTIKCCEELVSLSRLSVTEKLEKETSFFPCLHELSIECCPKLIELPNCLSSLVKLKITECVGLNELFAKKGKHMLCLRELSIWNCPKLRKLPGHLPSLLQLHLGRCLQLVSFPRFQSIRELRLEECNEVLLTSVVGLHSLNSLSICKIKKLRYFPEGLLKQLMRLKNLEINSCDMLETLSRDVSLQHLVSLQRLVISKCPQMEELPCQLHTLTTLKKLEIWACPRLHPSAETRLPSMLQDLWISSEAESLPVGMMHRISLGRLYVWNSHSLTSFQRCMLPSTLKTLAFRMCSKLESLPEEMIQHNSSLESLSIEFCESLHSLGLRAFTTATATKLRELKIVGCGNLNSFPEGLHNLTSLCLLIVISCPCLVSFPDGGFPSVMLRKLHISKCYELKSLPVYNVTSLEDLSIRKCPNLLSFPEGTLPFKLTRLMVDGCGKLKPISKWGFDRLTALKSLGIIGYVGQVSFAEGLLPYALTTLCLKNLPKMKFLGKGLQHLTSLVYLRILRCHSLSALPEEGLPVNLCFLQIVDCPRVKDQYEMKKRNGIQQYSRVSCLTWDEDF